ncbi:MAG: polyprenyl synthetase family protein [Acidobacteriota bacterium]|nr:polyprenyl synthetase family protein [Acidobacteriota bacterium]MDQ5838803.1 polyprenyl synthetase family protein [Acidobacteriota bacterium]
MTRASFEQPGPEASDARDAGAATEERGPQASTVGERDADDERHAAEGQAEASAAEVRAYFERVRALVESKLDEIVPAEDAEPRSVHAAMRWSLLAPAKRLRPALVFAAGEAFGARAESLIGTACAFELIHTYSLVHDDLPAMDDDELRRGRPTCHVRFGEATAILAGDALQALAFQTVADDAALDAALRVRLISELARAAGTPEGMVAGQAHDLEAEARADVGGSELELIHRRKTGALIAAAARAGASVAGATPSELEAVARYALELGLLFQITDDLLDVTASAEDLGKTPGKDARARKATYPSLYGLEAARARARQVYQSACAALDSIQRPTPMLRALARLVLERNN